LRRKGEERGGVKAGKGEIPWAIPAKPFRQSRERERKGENPVSIGGKRAPGGKGLDHYHSSKGV